uniref:Coproporphyrinogen oxidase n=1 Tax=Mesocestoides corti TaxID=53468 RepID=A0A5K3FBW3_MESCO
MSRRHLENALVAGALIENGLEPAFRFSRLRFQRTLYPPNYESAADDDDKETKSESLVCCQCGAQEVCVSLIKDPKTGKVQARCKNHPQSDALMIEDDYGVHSLQFSADGRQLIAGAANTSVRAIDVAEARQQLVLRPSKWSLGMPITCLRYMPTNFYWVLGCTPHGDIFCFCPDEEGFETLLTEDQQTFCLDISPDGFELATAGKDTQIRIYGLYPGQVTGFTNPKNTIKTVNRQLNPGKS